MKDGDDNILVDKMIMKRAQFCFYDLINSHPIIKRWRWKIMFENHLFYPLKIMLLIKG